MTAPTPPGRPVGTGLGPGRAVALAVGLGFAARVGLAVAVESAARRRGALCLFDDARIYWHLAGTLRGGGTYMVPLYDQPHYALRTPGYPLLIAISRAVFGDSTLAVRLLQAVLGAACALLVAALVRRVCPGSPKWTPVFAAGITAFEPYWVAASALILSEAAFVPPMLLMLLGLARLWPTGVEPTPRRPGMLAIGAGASAGAAILIRPSWALFVPMVLIAFVGLAGRGRRADAIRSAAWVAIGCAMVMAPWWARNARVFGRFVPTAIWAGASLYDGLRPGADGSSDMRFLDDPSIRSLDETAQDRELRSRALTFAASHPGRAAVLALRKLGRTWSPWPNAEGIGSLGAALVLSPIEIGLYVLIGIGAWDRRRDPRSLVLLLGPLLYFSALHMVFVGSVRYRIPAIVPAFGLAGIGLARWVGWGRGEVVR